MVAKYLMKTVTILPPVATMITINLEESTDMVQLVNVGLRSQTIKDAKTSPQTIKSVRISDVIDPQVGTTMSITTVYVILGSSQ